MFIIRLEVPDINLHIYLHNVPGSDQPSNIEGILNKMNADIKQFVTDVTTQLTGIAAGLVKVSADEDVIIQKLNDLSTSATLGTEDKAALAEVVTLATNLKNQVDTLDAKVPEAPTDPNPTV